MRVKELFTVPEGEKVTEKQLMRVLLSSVCSMLLCMACLVSVTWAWFSVDLENTGNVIQIAEVTANVQITGASQDATGSYTLAPGSYSVYMSAQCDAGQCIHGSHYILVTAVQSDVTQSCFVPIVNGTGAQLTIEVTGAEAKVSIGVSWLEPANAQPVEDGKLLLEAVQQVEPAENTDTTTEVTTAAE